jgi:hypothetical protein
MLLDRWTTGNTNGWQLYWRSTGSSITFFAGSAIVVQDPSASNITIGQWNHIAVSRSGTTVRLFINGVVVASATSSLSLSNTLPVGVGMQTSTVTNPFNGYLSGVRIVKGTAVYTTNFTLPTAPLSAVSGTGLLLNATNSNIYDQTGKVVTETVGDAKVSTSVVNYGGGSMAFDGTGDYLTIPNSPMFNFGSGNFTIECWIRVTTVSPSEQTIAGLYGYTSDRRSWDLAVTGSNIRIRTSTGGAAATISNSSTNSPITVNTWQHIAYVRNGSTVSGYVNGIQVVSTSISGSLFNNTIDPVSIGAVGPNYTGFFNGFISDLRITRGVARYTANFTPPTAQLGFFNPE